MGPNLCQYDEVAPSAGDDDDGAKTAAFAESERDTGQSSSQQQQQHHDQKLPSSLPQSPSTALTASSPTADMPILLSNLSPEERKDYEFRPKLYSHDKFTTMGNWHKIPARPGWRMFRDWFMYRIIPSAAGAWVMTRSIPFTLVAGSFFPIFAFSQGADGMLHYRKVFGGCPNPKAPTHGVVRTIERHRRAAEDSTVLSPENHAHDEHHQAITINGSVQHNHHRQQQKQQQNEYHDTDADGETAPLRLLVIGDSLACGVGQRQNATPILPEVIAKQLSRAMNGRPVLWTCHGAPGASAGWIVRELDRGAFHAQPHQLSNDIVAEPTEAMTTKPKASMSENGEANTTATTTTTATPSRSNSFLDENSSDIDDIVDADSSSSSVSTSTSSSMSHHADDEQSTTLQRDDRIDKQTWSERLKEQRIRFDPHTLSLFDMAIIMTGSNDLKSAFFPFLLTGEDAEFQRQANQRGGGYGTELNRVLTALNTQMRQRLQRVQESVTAVSQRMRGKSISEEDENDTADVADPPLSISVRTTVNTDNGNDAIIPDAPSFPLSPLECSVRATESSDDLNGGGGDGDNDDDNDGEQSDKRFQSPQSHHRHNPSSNNNHNHGKNSSFPVIVLPGMPSRVLPAFNRSPLRWLAIPMVDIMDSHKRRLAEAHNGEVLFVEPPGCDDMAMFYQQKGPYWYEKQFEKTILNLRDIKRRHAQRLQADMKSYFAQKELEFAATVTWWTRVMRWIFRPFGCFNETDHHYPLCSLDGVHPTDIGYEFWGRYIGHAIVREHNRQKMLKGNNAAMNDGDAGTVLSSVQ